MASPPKKTTTTKKRAHSIPFKRPFLIAATISFIFYLFFIASTAALISFLILWSELSAYTLISLTAVTFIFWALSILKRRNAHCPLCQGTPFLNNGAHLHKKATKLLIVNHGHSNILRTLLAQRFTCMYCGTSYDFLKPVTNPIYR